MSTTRAPKRRKLDEAQSSPAMNNASTKESSSSDAWIKAKAKVRGGDAVKYRTQEADVYDDIEGANVGQEPHGRPGRLPQKKSRSLDPLRNQKAQESASPKKAGAGVAVGFFKQFHRPKESVTLAENGKSANPAKDSARRKRSQEQPVFAEGEAWEENDDTGEIPNSEDEAEKTNGGLAAEEGKRAAEADTNSTGIWKGFVYGKPKKTFEDEIRELEETARRNAQDQDDDDELTSDKTPVRSSARKPTPRTATVKSKEREKPVSSPAAKATKPLDRRKAKLPVQHRQDAQSLAVEDSTEIGDAQLETLHKLPKAHAIAHAERVEERLNPKNTAGRPTAKATSTVEVYFESDILTSIQKVLLDRTTGKRPIALQNLDDEYVKVQSLVNQTVTAGESNSMLLIGARGSGKTALVNQILREQAIKHADDLHVVRLNGFIHTDDKIALREIWRQLGREMELDEDEATSKNYADTMSKLLALLSHPAEMGVHVTDQVTKSVIFVLDEFELFAGHPRQTLLYNLFDIAQSRKAPIAVLGLTTRIDAAESLEKRVKSRFSHRYVHLGLSKSFHAFQQICRSALVMTTSDMSDTTNSPTGDVIETSQWNDLVEQILAMESWNAHLHRLYCTTKSVPEFLTSLTLALATMPISSPTTTSTLLEHFSNAFAGPSLRPPDSKLSILPSLSSLQLALLICAARLTNIYSTEVISFALSYEEYKGLASKARLQASASGALAQGAGSKVWGKNVAQGAWEGLVDCGLIMDDGRAGGTGRVDVGLEEIGMCGVELGQWGRWCKEI